MISSNINDILRQLPPQVKLVAVSKFHPLECILEAYEAGQRLFGENRPQELAAKVAQLSSLPQDRQDIKWHFLGHLQTNKLKLVLPYVEMVQSVDSLHLLQAINKWGKDNGKKIKLLLELHIGAEQTKQGFVEEEILDILFDSEKYSSVEFCGLMGMASHSDCEDDIRADFTRISTFLSYLQDLFPELESLRELSIGMSSDWHIALDYGATMVRIGSSIFGEREYH